MDFGEILDQWEKRSPQGAKIEREETAPREPAPSRKALLVQEPQARLDLHRLSAPEAERALERFLRECRARGLVKVLVVHGKGHHSAGKPVLAAVVRDHLEKSPLAGAFGRADRRHGGSGATWVILRAEAYRSR